MQILTDAGCDLTAAQLHGLQFSTVPLTFTFEGKSYRSGIDIQPAAFYELLAGSHAFPTTSQPAPGDFVEAYQEMVGGGDPEILSIHISSGLSGTLNAARLAAQQLPQARITFVDTLSLSAAQGWQVEAAGRMIQAGWTLECILERLKLIGESTDTYFTLETLRYLEHGGRISHLQALVGQILDLKPIIGVEKERGTYVVHARERSLKRALAKMVEIVSTRYGAERRLRLQVMHAHNPAGAQHAVALLADRFDAHFLPVGDIAPVLGAHTGPGLVGVCAGPAEIFDDIPGML